MIRQLLKKLIFHSKLLTCQRINNTNQNHLCLKMRWGIPKIALKKPWNSTIKPVSKSAFYGLCMGIGYPKSHWLIITGWWFQPLWKIWKSAGITIPNTWKVIKAMFQTTNQIINIPYDTCYIIPFSDTPMCHGQVPWYMEMAIHLTKFESWQWGKKTIPFEKGGKWQSIPQLGLMWSNKTDHGTYVTHFLIYHNK